MCYFLSLYLSVSRLVYPSLSFCPLSRSPPSLSTPWQLVRDPFSLPSTSQPLSLSRSLFLIPYGAVRCCHLLLTWTISVFYAMQHLHRVVIAILWELRLWPGTLGIWMLQTRMPRYKYPLYQICTYLEQLQLLHLLKNNDDDQSCIDIVRSILMIREGKKN